jgi:hypothetical protein
VKPFQKPKILRGLSNSLKIHHVISNPKSIFLKYIIEKTREWHKK